MTSSGKSPAFIVMSNYKNIWGNKRHSNMDAILKDDTDPMTWIVRIRDIDGDEEVKEFTGGEYLIELTANEDPIAKPPKFKFLTPNGLYQVGSTSVCISVGQFHANNYAPAQGGMGGFAMQMANMLVFWRFMTSGLGFLYNDYLDALTKKVPAEEVKKMEQKLVNDIKSHASNSKKFNLSNYADYIKRLDSKKMNVLYNEVKESFLPSGLKNTMLKLITP
jgi:ubiquitin-protein ligase